jgi:Ca2+-binding RTX toxin-like protein
VTLLGNRARDGFGNTDTLSGIQGVRGTAGNDQFLGSDFVGFDSDHFWGLAGNDSIVGGLGNDEVRYDADASSGGAGAVTVNLATGTATDGFGNTDTLSGIENVRGSAQADNFTGDAGNNVFRGLGGSDIIDGGAGIDTVSYDRDEDNGGGSGVSVDLAAGTATDGFGNTDTLVSIEGARGTMKADTLVGTSGDNSFMGLAGNDFFIGGAGEDEIRYDVDLYRDGLTGVTVNLASQTATDGFGNTDTFSGIEIVRATELRDFLAGGTGDDTFRGLSEADSIDGGSGSDWVDYSADIFNRRESTVLGAVTVNLAAGTATDSFGFTDTLSGIENAAGGTLADTLTGDGNDNSFRGFGGNDTITGAGGSDTVDYSRDEEAGIRHFVAGNAAVVVNLSATTLTINGSAVQGNRARDGFGNTDTLSGIENAIGTAFDDVFVAGTAANRFDGGVGSDQVSYAASGTGVTANLDIGIGAGGDAAGDVYVSLEVVVGSAFGDTLVGRAGAANSLFGGDGNDFLYGEGLDFVSGGAGADVFFGGQGGALNLDLNAVGIETVWGSIGADTLNGAGSSVALTLIGQGGADIMTGGSGNDFLYFDSSDTISGGSGTDWAVVFAGIGAVTLNLTTTGFENAWGSTSADTLTAAGSSASVTLVGDAGNDVMTGGNVGDFLYGFSGSDTLNGGSGNDNLIGGADADTFVFAAGWGTDIVWDWQNGAEQFDMRGSGATSFGNLTVNQNLSGSGNALVTFGGNQVLVIGGANQIDAGDFIF